MILVLMAVCVFVMNGRTIDLWIMFGFGILGYLSERIRILLAPIVLGLILGPLAEQSLRRALLISRGDWTELVIAADLWGARHRNRPGHPLADSALAPTAAPHPRRVMSTGLDHPDKCTLGVRGWCCRC